MEEQPVDKEEKVTIHFYEDKVMEEEEEEFRSLAHIVGCLKN